MQASNSPEDRPTSAPTRREALVPALAVSAVAIVAIAAAVMVRRVDSAPQAPRIAQSQSQTRSEAAPAASVVTAPPLRAPDTRAMGGRAACATCGVVQTVVAVYDEGGKEPTGYQMHIRMDDGSVRMVKQRGALAAGSRVVVDGQAVRPMS
jgi:hypothetical protein